MLKELVTAANKLDMMGYAAEADFLDSLIKEAAEWKLLRTEMRGDQAVEVWLNPMGETILRPLGPAPKPSRAAPPEGLAGTVGRGLDWAKEKGSQLGPDVLKYWMPGAAGAFSGDAAGAMAEQREDWTKYHPGLAGKPS